MPGMNFNPFAKTKELEERRAKKKSAPRPRWNEVGWTDTVDGLEDFDSDGFTTWRPTRRARTDYLDSMWGRGWGGSFRKSGQADVEDLVVAQKMVSAFVNALGRGSSYEVVFDASTSSAGTDMKRRKVVITPGPVLDPTLDATQAGRVLTGMAVHEICHPRFGEKTFAAAMTAFEGDPLANEVSNLLDDIRIERRFVDAYPGYSGVFAPTLDYLGAAQTKKTGKLKPHVDKQLDVAIAATRYPLYAEWKGWEDERDWWTDWGERWAREDSPRRHVLGVREALEHMLSVQARQTTTGSKAKQVDGKGVKTSADGSSDRSKDDSEDGSKAGGSNDDKDKFEEYAASLKDAVLAGQIRDASDQLDPCMGSDELDKAAQSNGVSDVAINTERHDADERVKDEQFFESTSRPGEKVEVVRSMNGMDFEHQSYLFAPSPQAAREVRAALERSRTGHTAESRYRRRGTLDHASLSRTAHGDFRLFSKRKAQSTGKYLIWVMVDVSSSMRGKSVLQAAQVAHAVADATTHVKNVRAAVWGWSSAFRTMSLARRGDALAIWDPRAGVALAWQTGMPSSEVKEVMNLIMGNTPDASVMRWAWPAIKREARRDETPVILFASDGRGRSDMIDAVNDARANGVQAYGVEMKSELQMERMFGKENVVQWRGSILATARPLANLIARIVAS